MSAAVVVLTETQLAELLERSATRGAELALASHVAERASGLVSGGRMAQLLNVSRSTMHRMRLAGAPAIKLGDTYKYEPDAVIAWARGRE